MVRETGDGWPEWGRVGICTTGEAIGQHVLLMQDGTDRWLLYLEPPWEKFHFGASRFGLENVIVWDQDVSEIMNEWGVRWIDGSEGTI